MTGPGQQYPHNQQFPAQPGGQPGGQPFPGGPQQAGAPAVAWRLAANRRAAVSGRTAAAGRPAVSGRAAVSRWAATAGARAGAQQFPGAPLGWQQTPPRKKRSKAPWLITGSVLLLVVAVFLVLGLTKKTPVPNNAAAPTATTTTTAPPKPQPGQPIPCQGDEKFYCVPGITDVTRQVQPGMQAQGYTCGPAASMADAIDHSVNLFCENTTDPKASRQIKIDFAADDEKATNLVLGKVDVSGMADTWESTDLSQDAWTQERQGFDVATAVVFAQAPKVRQDFDAWLTTNAAACSSGKNAAPTSGTEPTAHVDGYIITCQPPSPVSISGDKGTNTNYEGVINLDVNPYAFLDNGGN